MRSLLILTLLAASIPLPAAADGPDHLILGYDEDAEIMLLRPLQAKEGPDGNLYVLDGGDARIKVFSPDGEALRQLAGEGEGPGYFQRVDGATFGFMPDGRLYFTEFIRGHRWITTMDRHGDDVRVVSIRLDADFGVERAVPLADGGFLVQLIHGSTPRAEGDHFLYVVPQTLVRLDAAGEIVSRLVRTELAKYISYSPNGGTSNLPFTPSFAWCLLDDGRVAWSDGSEPTLHVYGFDGTRLGGIETPLPAPEPVTKEELEAWQAARRERLLARNPEWWQRFGRVVEDYDRSLYDKPVLQRIERTPAGNLLVEGAWEAESEVVRYKLLDRDGAWLADVAAGVWRLHLSATYLIYFTSGDDGETLVHARRRPADEAAALALVEAGGESE